MIFSLRSLLQFTALSAVVIAVSGSDWLSGTLILTIATTIAVVYWSASAGRKDLAKIGALASTGVFWASSFFVVLSDVLTPRPADPRSDYFVMQDGYLPTLVVFFLFSSIVVCILGGIVGFAWERACQRGHNPT